MALKYKRVLLKLSGEVLKGDQDSGIQGRALLDLAKKVKSLQDLGCEIGMVIGGGNIWRYRDNQDLEIERVTSDTMGMMATVMNALAFEEALKSLNVNVRAMSSFSALKAMEDYVPKRARHHLAEKRVVVFAGGTGSPYCTTDSAAALRALEMNCDLLLKATKVDFVYDKDPNKHSDALKFEELTYEEIIEKKLGVMDLTCASLCAGSGMPMIVFNINSEKALLDACMGKKVGTFIS
jgi:uridylate kinase